jgi:hypothetical protein
VAELLEAVVSIAIVLAERSVEPTAELQLLLPVVVELVFQAAAADIVVVDLHVAGLMISAPVSRARPEQGFS